MDDKKKEQVTKIEASQLRDYLEKSCQLPEQYEEKRREFQNWMEESAKIEEGDLYLRLG